MHTTVYLVATPLLLHLNLLVTLWFLKGLNLFERLLVLHEQILEWAWPLLVATLEQTYQVPRILHSISL